MIICTCAFLPFAADEPFFARDSGLLARALQKSGHESKVIMPAFPDGRPNDSDSVVRGTLAELHDPRWWRSLEIEAVAFICWGFREHTPIIRAAAEGGVTTCAVFDSNCNGFPYLDFFSTIRSNWRKGYLSESIPKRVVGTLARMSVFLVKGLFQNYHAYAQARAAHLSAYNSQSSFERAKLRARVFGGHEIIPSMRLMGYPIPDEFAPQPAEKRIKKMVAVARWDAVRHKRPDILMQVVEQIAQHDPSIHFEIFGRLPQRMISWHESLPKALRDKIVLSGIRPSQQISKTIGESWILYCPSAIEGVPLPVIEALCGGCTVVGLGTDDIPGLAWAFREGDGTPVLHDTVEHHVRAILQEFDQWESHRREPMTLARKWNVWFSATSYADRLVREINEARSTYNQNIKI